MQDYVKTMIQDFPSECLTGKKLQASWDANLIKVDEDNIPLNQKIKEQFYKTMYQALFLCKQGRPNIMPGSVFLITQV